MRQGTGGAGQVHGGAEGAVAGVGGQGNILWHLAV